MEEKPSSGEAAQRRQESIDLLNQTHQFPQPVLVKVIGRKTDLFVEEVKQIVQHELRLSVAPDTTARETAGGRHVAITLEPMFESAEQVLDLYDVLQKVPEVVMLL